MNREKLYKEHAKLKKLFFKTRRKKENLEFKRADITKKMTDIMNRVKEV